MIQLIDLASWVTRLKATCPAFGSRFYQTLPDDELEIERVASPAGFVYLSEDASDDNRDKNGRSTRQILTSQVTIETVLRRTASKTDTMNSASVALIRTYRLELFNALIGWQPTDAIKPVQHVGGKLVRKETKLIKWADTFSTANVIDKQN